MKLNFPCRSCRAPFKIRREIDFTLHQKQCTVLTSNLMLKETLQSRRCGMIWMIHESLWTVWKWGSEKWSVMLSSTTATVVATVFNSWVAHSRTGKERLDKRTCYQSGAKPLVASPPITQHGNPNFNLDPQLKTHPQIKIYHKQMYFVVFALKFKPHFKLVFRLLFATWIIFYLGLVNIP